MSEQKYTLVHHTGLPHAVELRGINGRQARSVRSRGGLVFDHYNEAVKAEEGENYPPEVTGLNPHVRGSFVSVPGMDEAVYIPKYTPPGQ